MHKSLIDSQSLQIKFNKIDTSIRFCDGTSYLALFGSQKYDSIYNRIRYLISVKSGITYIISHNYATVQVDSYNFFPLEKTMTLCNIIILITQFGIKIKITITIFLEKASYEFPRNKFSNKIQIAIS